jgi:hypothetical protein
MRKKRSVGLITCCPLAHTTRPYLYNSTLISLQLFKLTPISLQLNLWLIWTLSHDLYLFELLTWYYSDSNSTWSPPQLNFQLNWIPHCWTLLGSVMAHLGLDSSFLKLKVLIPLWTRTLSQFRLVSLIFFLNSSKQLTRVISTLSAHPTSLDRLTRIPPKQLAWTPPNCLTRALPNHINVYPALYVHTQPNYLTRFFSRSDFYLPSLTRSYPAELPYPILLPIKLLLTQPYTVWPDRITLPNFSPDRTFAYPIVPGHLTRLSYLAG